MSQANLDHGLEQYFGDSQEEMYYGSVRIQPLAYQDDVLKGSKDVPAAQIGSIRIARTRVLRHTQIRSGGLEHRALAKVQD